MRAYAAIDVRGGRVVQLVGGRADQERISLADPAAVARQWIDAGFGALHVVDLDGAFGSGDNAAAVAAVLDAARSRAFVQVGGGVRDGAAVERAIASGADAVVTGTRGVRDPAWLRDVAHGHPGRIVLAADAANGRVVTDGWTRASGQGVLDLLRTIAELPLAGVLVTDVTREGSMAGVDAALFRDIVGGSRHPIIAAGGIASRADLCALADAGVAGAVLGMSLYTGALDARAVAREFTE